MTNTVLAGIIDSVRGKSENKPEDGVKKIQRFRVQVAVELDLEVDVDEEGDVEPEGFHEALGKVLAALHRDESLKISDDYPPNMFAICE